ncbi:MAG: LysR family transcriptional regulator [Enterocloster sp.]
MELRQLEYFMVTCEKGSFNQAAECLYTTQPNVSKVISSLEKELGRPLFERTAERESGSPLMERQSGVCPEYTAQCRADRNPWLIIIMGKNSALLHIPVI